MSGELASAGDIATGGLIGRAVEPRAGEAGHGAPTALCLNCGTALAGDFCHACGQAGHVHRTLASIGHDLLHGVFHFEGKIWRTLPMLVFRPGVLTRRYIAGERARFVSPLAVFLFTVFLLFAVVAALPGWKFPESDLLKGDMIENARVQIGKERVRAVAELADQKRDLGEELRDPGDDPTLVDRLRERIARQEKANAELAKAEALMPKPSAKAARDAKPEDWFGAKVEHARENPQLLFYKLKSSAYKYSWALIPLSLPFIWLLFPLRRDVGLYEHATFATYSLTFVSLLVIILALLNAIGVPNAILTISAVFVPPVHMYRHLKDAYRLRRAGALVRTVVLLGCSAMLVTPLFMFLLLYLGVAD